MSWHITVGDYRLALLGGVEINRSVDNLADTCDIILPGYAYNKAFHVEGLIHRGDKVTVDLGYDDNNQEEFTGYLLNISTDDGNLTLRCENGMFLLRKTVADKSFKNVPVEKIARYLLDELQINMNLDCTLGTLYDKFVVSKATAYDVLKKLKEETKAIVFITGDKDGGFILHIHPPYVDHFKEVVYSFQYNIEKDDLKYKSAEDKKVQVIVSGINKNGGKTIFKYGTTGGERINIDGSGMSKEGMKIRAKTEYELHLMDGYDGSITTWMIPKVDPGDGARIVDEDYKYKEGLYYVNSVKTTFDKSGGIRKVQLGKRLS